jgi:Carboxypeptidase regulatory-like domain
MSTFAPNFSIHTNPFVRMNYNYTRKLTILLALLWCSLAAFAQVTTSSISGLVTDKTGEGLIGATVVAVHVPSGTRYGAITNALGRFTLPAVRVGGPFTLTTTYTGYENTIKEGIFTSLGNASVVDIQMLESGISLSETVVVASRSDLISDSRTGASSTFNKGLVTTLPVVGARSINEITKYNPNGNGRSFGGQDSRLNNFTIDGSVFNNGFGLGDASQAGGRTNSTAISLDAIEEVQVNVAPFDVRQSSFVGSGINAVTRSGTNEISGSVYYNFRNNSSSLNGSKVKNEEVSLGKFNEKVIGARIGGPLIKNKLFFFANAEIQRRTEPATNWVATGSPNKGQVSLVDYNDMVNLSKFMKEKFGYETGPFENFDDQTESNKYLFRLDYNLNDAHKVTLRYTHHDSKDYVMISNSASLGRGNRRDNIDAMSFQNSGYFINDNTRSIVGELNSTLNEKLHNNLIIGYDAQNEDREYAGAFFPTVDILRNSRTYIGLGFDPFTPDNQLNYSTFHVTDNISYYAGKHTITGGVNYEYYKSNNLFFPGSNAVYSFNSLDDFYKAANATTDTSPVRLNLFQYRYSALPGNAKPLQVLETNRIDFYLQDAFQMFKNFKLTYGLRAGVIGFKDSALPNSAVDNLTYIDDNEVRGYKVSTGSMPKTQVLWEPRLGFNWDVTNKQKLQVRGGTGIFTGRPPFVWISNQVGNTGVLTGFIEQANTTKYKFSPDGSIFTPDNPTLPTTFDIAVTAPDYKFPQVWKSTVGVDYKLPLGLVATAEFLYNKNINAAYYFDANLEPSTGARFTGPDTRQRFPGSGLTGASRNNALRVNDNISRAAVLGSTDEGDYIGYTFKLEYPTKKGLNAMLAYTYSQAQDLMSAGSIASGSWTSARSLNGNNNLSLAFADGDIPHRLIGYLGYRLEYGKDMGGATQFVLGYEGSQSNRFTYSAAGDLNGDGVNDNDLLYVPNSANDLVFLENTVTYRDSKGASLSRKFSVEEQKAAFDKYIQQDEYLNSRRGQYAERNAAIAPILHRFDLSVIQEFYIKLGGKRNTIQLRADILNIGNLLSPDFGVRQRFVTNRPLSFASVTAAGVPQYRLATETINGVPELISTTFRPGLNPSDVWNAQLGIRYIFN